MSNRPRLSPFRQWVLYSPLLLGFHLSLLLSLSSKRLGQRECHLLVQKMGSDGSTKALWLLSLKRSLVARTQLRARAPCHPRVRGFARPVFQPMEDLQPRRQIRIPSLSWFSGSQARFPVFSRESPPVHSSFADILLPKYCPVMQQLVIYF